MEESTRSGSGFDLFVIDADDTLWESALYFERAEEDFILLTKSLGFAPLSVRRLVHSRDIERLAVTGYGARPYLGTLRSVLDELCPRRPSWADTAFGEISRALLEHPVILLPGARESLEWLRERNLPTVVYTMGEQDHQLSKFSRSGLSDLVEECVVVDRKTPLALADLLSSKGVEPSRSMVIGNSPRSDVNPALQIGAGAVLCARERLWQAEREEILDPGRVHHLETLSELPNLLSSLQGGPCAQAGPDRSAFPERNRTRRR